MRRPIQRMASTLVLATVWWVGCAPVDATVLSQCEYGEWSPPAVVSESLGGANVIREPDLAWNGSETVLVGTEAPANDFDPTPLTTGRLIVHGLHGGRWPDLTGDYAFLAPQAVFDRGGTLHLVWAEPDSMPTTSLKRRAAAPTSLWHARLQPGGSWSAPAEIVRASRILWSRESAVLAVDADGHVQVIAPIFARSGTHRTVHLVETGRDWVRYDTSLPWGGYMTAVVDQDVPLAAYVTDSPRYGTNAVFVTRFPADSSVSRRRPIATSDDRLTVYFIKLLRAGDGRIHLLWARGEKGFAISEIVHTRYSADGWSPSVSIELSAPALSIDVAADRCGGLHLVYSVWDAGVPMPRYRRWRGAWSEELPLPPTPVALEPILGRAPSGGRSWSGQPHPIRRPRVRHDP